MSEDIKIKHNWIWIGILAIVIILAIVLVSNSNKNSQDSITCNSPYIKVGTSCCLDENSNNICDNDEQSASVQVPTQEEIKRNVIALDSLDYDKKTKQIVQPEVSYNEYISNWEMVIIGYDSNGNEVFKREDNNGAGYSNDERRINFESIDDIPYLEGGNFNIKFISKENNLEITGSYQYSTFDTSPSFNVEYLEYDAREDAFKYKITNTGKRDLYVERIVSIVFNEKCGEYYGALNSDGDWVAVKTLDSYDNLEVDALSNGESLMVWGIAPTYVDSGDKFCTRFNYELPYYNSPVEMSKELSFTI